MATAKTVERPNNDPNRTKPEVVDGISPVLTTYAVPNDGSARHHVQAAQTPPPHRELAEACQKK